MDIVREIRTAVKTGKVAIGSKETINTVINGNARLVIISSNIPQTVRRDIERYCKLSKTPLYEYPGTSWDLGAACNKPFMVSALAVLEPGESGILYLVKGGD
ncbi:MAG: 50S ribosomal protein L30e [Thermofilaceae archaeon]|nr:50S ribosomal protein L30e [Thermofilaceae archaeon]MCX8181076.1 50S ribosomal protein L30e [Thermofilaceae archaeon]MDW8004557.1 50S ribosomal protein L30e [Thermofilaceae archaeon]